MRVSLAALRLAQNNPQDAIAALAPLLDSSALGTFPGQPALSFPHVQFWGAVFVMEAIAQDALGDSRAASSALERALDRPNLTARSQFSCCIPRRPCLNATSGNTPPTPP